jgi:hypothetical protein
MLAMVFNSDFNGGLIVLKNHKEVKQTKLRLFRRFYVKWIELVVSYPTVVSD